ncbi:hypothetical protein ERJ75_001237300 [Trypanosoma vivax]|uniref:BAR domain-containing protein n=1 Tax=Trypanosoma vivax (strain Y486) TaxID=1055687 RepID=F9WSD0_TRYVY|nr:hypothetical protein ERJ75_001237300 [Trypanosoma vivax]CCD20469.1 hypothetical protein, conserved [Trypanosoma vivax Y486]|eukprot:CCD20469.1 hypothetical protein, conserved [Trypanosoma vivax Y486]
MLKKKRVDPTDPNAILLKNISDGTRLLGEAMDRYISAMHNVDSSIQQISSALRLLSIGDIPQEVRERVESFACGIDRHQESTVVRTVTQPTKSQTKGRLSGNSIATEPGVACDIREVAPANSSGYDMVEASSLALPTSGDGSPYNIAPYVNDLSKEMIGLLDSLRAANKVVKRHQEERDELVRKYHSVRSKVEKIAAEDVKKCRNSEDNPKYVKKAEEREFMRNELEKQEVELNQMYSDLLQHRAESVQRAVNALSTYSKRYLNGLMELMLCNDKPAAGAH